MEQTKFYYWMAGLRQKLPLLHKQNVICFHLWLDRIICQLYMLNTKSSDVIRFWEVSGNNCCHGNIFNMNELDVVPELISPPI